MSPKDAALVSAAASTLNKFGDDGSFMSKILVKQNEDAGGSVDMLFKVFLREERRMKMLIGISLNGQADDEYDFENGPRSKPHKKGRDSDHKVSEKNDLAKRILTQQERFHFIFENPNRPKHLVVSIANFTYLLLPQWQPVHDSAARNVDNNVWEEIHNFKKCLMMMFSKQEKDLMFLETAIHEAEDEWSQHNTKKLTDTSEKGLRGSIPKDFPYFHVEFGLHRGFVHDIDDKKNFKSSLGNVMRGMLHLPEEDMYRRQRHGPMEAQKLAVAQKLFFWQIAFR
ncbi:hypothetical protein Peur_023509 [Populus x canadensis]